MVIAAPALNFQPRQATLPVNSFMQRLLLVSDNNVADIIQSYAAEAIEVLKLQQKLMISSSRFSPLRLDREYQLLERSILLQGSTTETNYLYATSHIVLERLATDIRDGLIFSRQSLNHLLRENQIHTYRKTIDCGFEPAGFLGEYFQIEPTAEVIFRTYLVLIDGLPVISITEKFPTTSFVD